MMLELEWTQDSVLFFYLNRDLVLPFLLVFDVCCEKLIMCGVSVVTTRSTPALNFYKTMYAIYFGCVLLSSEYGHLNYTSVWSACTIMIPFLNKQCISCDIIICMLSVWCVSKASLSQWQCWGIVRRRWPHLLFPCSA